MTSSGSISKKIRNLDMVDAIGGSGDPGDLRGPIKGSVGEGGSYLREGTLGENTMRLVRSLNGKERRLTGEVDGWR